MIMIYLFIFLLLIAPIESKAKTLETVSATYTYYLSANESEKEGKSRALEYARLKALSEAFGTYVSSSKTLTQHLDGLGERETFNSYSSSDILGIWVKTIEENTEIKMEGQNIVINAFVKGVARSRELTVAEFEVHVGRVDDNFRLIPTNSFYDRERFDISFTSPQSGYVAIYASDGVNDVCRLLPDAMSSIAEPIKVEGRKEYRFFEDTNPVMALGAGEESALLRITFLFVPDKGNEPFVLPIDKTRCSVKGDILGRSVSDKTYQRWLGKLMNNPSLQRRDITISINKPNN